MSYEFEDAKKDAKAAVGLIAALVVGATGVITKMGIDIKDMAKIAKEGRINDLEAKPFKTRALRQELDNLKKK